MASKTRAPVKRKPSGGSRTSKKSRKAKSATPKAKVKPTKAKAKPTKKPPKTPVKKPVAARKPTGRVVSRPALRPVQGKPERVPANLITAAEKFADALEHSGPLIPTVHTRLAPKDVIWHAATRIEGDFNYKQMLDALNKFNSTNLIGKNRLAFVRFIYQEPEGLTEGYAPTAATTWANVLATLKNDFDPSKSRSLANRYRRSKIVQMTIWWGPLLS